MVPNLLDPEYYYNADIDFTREQYFSLQKDKVGFLLRPGQQLILSDFEQKNQKYVWEYDVEGCKEKPQENIQGQPKPQNKNNYKDSLLKVQTSRWSDISRNRKSMTLAGNPGVRRTVFDIRNQDLKTDVECQIKMTMKSYTRQGASLEEVQQSIWKKQNINIKILAPVDPTGAPKEASII